MSDPRRSTALLDALCAPTQPVDAMQIQPKAESEKGNTLYALFSVDGETTSKSYENKARLERKEKLNPSRPEQCKHCLHLPV